MQIPRLAAGAAFVLSLVATAAHAQEPLDPTEMSLEALMSTPVERVYGASRFLQKVADAPASITIITADEIRLYGYRTLADVLRSVQGVSVSYDRNYTYVGLRGLSRPGDYNTRVLVLVDGHRANDNVEDMATLGTDFELDADLIQRVEVIRGPSAVFYGSSAFSAVVAVVTRQGHHLDGVDASASTASFGTDHTRVSWGKRYSPALELLVSGSVYRSAGASPLYFPEFAGPGGGGYAVRADGERANKMTVGLTMGDFAIHGVYSGRTKQVPTASFGTVFNSGREQTFDGRGWVDVQFSKEMGRSFDLLARAYWDRYAYDGDYPYAGDSDAAPPIINHDRFRGRWWGAEADVSSRAWRAHRVTVGAEFRRNDEQSTINYDEAPATVYIDHRPHSYIVAVNALDEYTINRRVMISVAGREERLQSGTVGFTPKAGLILTPRLGTTVKLLFSRALRSPSAYELYYDSPANVGNAALGPERTESFELSVAHAITPAMSVEGSLYRNTYRDLIVGVASPSATVALANALDARADGVELAWSIKQRRGLQARASHSTLFDSDAASDAWTSGAPKHLTKLNVGGRLGLGVTAGLEVQHESVRFTHAGERLDAATIVNLNLTRAIFTHVEVRASLFNVFNDRYSEPVSENHRQGGIAQDGRQFLVGLTWRSK